ncbi:hypothetical protein F8S13_24135 [Chloroflexia bacterium SDU3-3]|nr:hypothetical protein F8S13_24135 [Chloroflexia bacterium SDU3-3]
MTNIEHAYKQVEQFKGTSFRKRIADLEAELQGVDQRSCQHFYSAQQIDTSLLIAALFLKKASSQINEVVHALGIILSLPYLLREGEMIEYVSLAAGNTGRPFDLETNMRVAEFKFTDWKGGPEAVRQNQLFKDFYLLAEYDTPKERFLYFVGEAIPMRFLRGRRALRSVLSRSTTLWADFQEQYGAQFKVVTAPTANARGLQGSAAPLHHVRYEG